MDSEKVIIDAMRSYIPLDPKELDKARNKIIKVLKDLGLSPWDSRHVLSEIEFSIGCLCSGDKNKKWPEKKDET